MVNVRKNQLFTVREMSFCAVFTALMAVCSWISIPLTVPVTLQTFAVFAAVLLLGTKCSFASLTVWLMLCAVGVPVLAGFKGGIGALAGPAGGYVLGFLACPFIVAAVTKLFGKNLVTKAVGLVLSLIACYAFGTVWFVEVYSRGGEAISFVDALKLCVLPFIAFDAVKIAMALVLDNRIGRFMPLNKD